MALRGYPSIPHLLRENSFDVVFVVYGQVVCPVLSPPPPTRHRRLCLASEQITSCSIYNTDLPVGATLLTGKCDGDCLSLNETGLLIPCELSAEYPTGGPHFYSHHLLFPGRRSYLVRADKPAARNDGATLNQVSSTPQPPEASKQIS